MTKTVLIAEAGGTSTQWRLARGESRVEQFETIGYNPQTGSLEKLLAGLQRYQIPLEQISHLHFYAAGLVGDNQKIKAKRQLREAFTNANIEVQSDVLAAARGLCGAAPGWVGFLGTGSGLAFYNGESISHQIPSLGYILGDEGGGAYIGKLVTRDYFRKKLPDAIVKQLKSSFDSLEEELSKIYHQSGGSAHLARLTKCLSEHLDHPYVFALIENAFHAYFDAFLPDRIEDQVHFTGSIAFHFNSILRQVALNRGISTGRIVQSPIAGLLLYHEV